MNNRVIQFSCSALNGTGKQGVLPKDSDGYYTIPVGALNVFNSVGDYYPYEAAKNLFENSSSLMRRVSTGTLKGELGHPKPLPGQSLESYTTRVLTIEETNVCAHFSKIWIDFDNVRDSTGKPVIAILAKVAPSGPHSQALQSSLDNRKEDVCFSIRSFTEDVPMGGVKHRMLRNIVTWDCVTEPGLSVARKYNSPTLESYQDSVIDESAIVGAYKSMIKPGISMESSAALGADLLQVLGIRVSDKPNYVKW